jgi:hypothetical protein
MSKFWVSGIQLCQLLADVEKGDSLAKIINQIIDHQEIKERDDETK